MSGTVDSLAPKRIRKTESPEVSETQATAQAAQAFQVDWSHFPDKEIISKIGLHLNKQDASSLKCVCRAFNTEVLKITQPLTPIRAEFKADWRMLKSDATIPAYMYDHVQELTGHTNMVSSVTQLKDGRIVSGSEDNTIRVWDLGKREDEDGYVRVLTGHTSDVYSITQLKDGRIDYS